MKRRSYAQIKLNLQRSDRARELHYARVEAIAIESIKGNDRSKRLGIITRKGIKVNKEIELNDGTKVVVRRIRCNGFIVLSNWDEIDPLDLDK